MKILLVEDEKKVASFIQRGLEEERYQVDLAFDGRTGATMAVSESYDAIILDIQLPGMDGLDVLRYIRGHGVTAPVLMLTVRDSVEDKVTALDSGGDDYLTKPFAFAELLARLRALMRRGQQRNGENRLEAFGVTVDLHTHQVTRNGRTLDLTGKEYALLELFLRHPGKVLTRTMIAEQIWGYNFDSFTNVIDVYVNYLRKKLDQTQGPKLIHTVRGVGYVLRREEDSGQ
ncbi:MAG: response regulator transcription factor [Armatimonadetes bacterium]|jgi:heavy metal response regulator|nr:response regulator transcription factor [Armatimonadota bacterium]